MSILGKTSLIVLLFTLTACGSDDFIPWAEGADTTQAEALAIDLDLRAEVRLNRAEARTVVAIATRHVRNHPDARALRRIHSSRVRRAATHTLRAIEALADAEDLSAAEVSQRYNAFLRSFGNLASTSSAEGGTGPETCTFKCKSEGDECQEACPKKHCGCKLAAAGCIISSWIHGTC